MARLVGINHVALEVGDVEEALELYGRLFEFTLRGRAGRWRSSTWATSSWRCPRAVGRTPDDGRHFGLVVDDKPAVRAAVEREGLRHPPRPRARLPRPVGQPLRDRRLPGHPVRARPRRQAQARDRGAGEDATPRSRRSATAGSAERALEVRPAACVVDGERAVGGRERGPPGDPQRQLEAHVDRVGVRQRALQRGQRSAPWSTSRARSCPAGRAPWRAAGACGSGCLSPDTSRVAAADVARQPPDRVRRRRLRPFASLRRPAVAVQVRAAVPPHDLAVHGRLGDDVELPAAIVRPQVLGPQPQLEPLVRADRPQLLDPVGDVDEPERRERERAVSSSIASGKASTCGYVAGSSSRRRKAHTRS